MSAHTQGGFEPTTNAKNFINLADDPQEEVREAPCPQTVRVRDCPHCALWHSIRESLGEESLASFFELGDEEWTLRKQTSVLIRYVLARLRQASTGALSAKQWNGHRISIAPTTIQDARVRRPNSNSGPGQSRLKWFFRSNSSWRICAGLIELACGACLRTIVLRIPMDFRSYAEKDCVPLASTSGWLHAIQTSKERLP